MPTKTILLVDDEPTVRSLIARVLTAHGYDVLQAHSAEDALSCFEQRHGAVDLVLTDVCMPGPGGPGLVRRMRSLVPGLPAVFMSGYQDEALAGAELAVPGTAFVQKPFGRLELVSLVAATLRDAPVH